MEMLVCNLIHKADRKQNLLSFKCTNHIHWWPFIYWAIKTLLSIVSKGKYLLKLPLSRRAISNDISVLRSFSCRSMFADWNIRFTGSVNVNIEIQRHWYTNMVIACRDEISNRRWIHLQVRKTPGKVSFDGSIIPLSKAKRKVTEVLELIRLYDT